MDVKTSEILAFLIIWIAYAQLPESTLAKKATIAPVTRGLPARITRPRKPKRNPEAKPGLYDFFFVFIYKRRVNPDTRGRVRAPRNRFLKGVKTPSPAVRIAGIILRVSADIYSMRI